MTNPTDYPCPTCDSQPGERCTTGRGFQRALMDGYHDDRQDTEAAIEAAMNACESASSYHLTGDCGCERG